MAGPTRLTKRQRLKDDFPYYAPRCLSIRTKDMRIAPLVLNRAQLYLHEQIEDQRRRTGKVRKLILKGRQQGCSTYVEARYYWRVSHRKGARAYILTHEDQATQNLFGIAKRYHDHCPDAVRPHTGTANANELVFDDLDSGYRVGTAGKKETGRSHTVQFFHGSEVAFWPNAETHMAGVVQAVPDLPDTEVIFESTSAGAMGMFYQMCRDAHAGQGDFELVFIPWFWQDEYRKDATGFEPTAEERAYGEPHGLDHEQLAWRRAKIQTLRGVHVFRREYPATVEEAFRAEMPGALWRRDVLDATRRTKADIPVPTTRVVVALDPATTKKRKSNETGVIVACRDRAGHAYVVADHSGKYTPAEWSTLAVELYDKFQADSIVYESNQGGDMIPHTLRTVRKGLSLRGVSASRGKQTRADPIAGKFREGLAHIVGHLPALEDQLCTWVPVESGEEHQSPDRLDAMVWALWALLIEPVSTVPPIGIASESYWAAA